MRTVPATEASRTLPALNAELARTGEAILIVSHKQPVAWLLPHYSLDLLDAKIAEIIAEHDDPEKAAAEIVQLVFGQNGVTQTNPTP